MGNALLIEAENIADEESTLEDRASRVSGATGVCAYKINGVYMHGGGIFNDRSVYYRLKTQSSGNCCVTLSYDKSDRWIVGEALFDDVGVILLAYCERARWSDPTLSTKWYVATADDRCKVQPGVKIETIHAGQEQAERTYAEPKEVL